MINWLEYYDLMINLLAYYDQLFLISEYYKEYKALIQQVHFSHDLVKIIVRHFVGLFTLN